MTRRAGAVRGTAAAALSSPAAVLVRRELNVTLVWLAAGAACAAAAAAYQAYGPAAGLEIPLFGRLLRRFDLALLTLIIPFMVLRSATRLESDHKSGWLGPYLAAGGSRASFGLAYSLAGLSAPVAMYGSAAVTFAFSVAALTGSSELAALLPRTIASGLLVLLTYAGVTATVSLLVRPAVGATALVLGAALLPQALLIRHAAADSVPPPWTLALQFAAPAVVLPSSMAGVLHALLYGSAMIGVAVLVSARCAGRTA